MKKAFLFMSAVLVGVVLMSSCKKDNPVLGAYVAVTVVNALDVPIEGETVYMFKDTEPTSDTPKGDALKTVITNSNGVAEFGINFTQLNILEGQTNIYFVVYYGDTIFKTVGMTVSSGDSKTAKIQKIL